MCLHAFLCLHDTPLLWLRGALGKNAYITQTKKTVYKQFNEDTKIIQFRVINFFVIKKMFLMNKNILTVVRSHATYSMLLKVQGRGPGEVECKEEAQERWKGFKGFRRGWFRYRMLILDHSKRFRRAEIHLEGLVSEDFRPFQRTNDTCAWR